MLVITGQVQIKTLVNLMKRLGQKTNDLFVPIPFDGAFFVILNPTLNVAAVSQVTSQFTASSQNA
jgi:hypothetical protein